MSERRFFFNEALHNQQFKGDSQDARWPGECVPSNKDAANLIGSLCDDGFHMPVIDIDLPVRVVPSTTPGHGHLYIDLPMTWDAYLALLEAMVAAGIVDRRYVDHSRERGMTLCRPEWVRKS